jgi:hypothetical protein
MKTEVIQRRFHPSCCIRPSDYSQAKLLPLYGKKKEKQNKIKKKTLMTLRGTPMDSR